MQTLHYPPYPPTGPPPYPALGGYPAYSSPSTSDPRFPPPLSSLAMAMTMPHPSSAPSSGHKRLAPPHPHPAESPAKKKQSKWSGDEDARIVELRGRNLKWEDVARHLPGRSAISCRLRFQNYLERRAEWDEEKKNKLARLYERFKKDMWEKIAKEMQLPWRAAEAMHWQIGEVEMAQRANVPVFHLAGPITASSAAAAGAPHFAAEAGPGIPSPASTSMPCASSGAYAHTHTHTHTHTLPQLPQPYAHPPISPEQARLRSNSNGSSPSAADSSRHRADSARSVPTSSTMTRTLLPPLGDLTGPVSQTRYTLPPVVTSPDVARR
ncbi:hypothetical protein LTR53_005400 [Teratosphaeriaceae sp. CCFEE 6253]|nr:hypothetical protein LTR53_005400 [Teratosphaeriaceae sp. CCFEE 6253]